MMWAKTVRPVLTLVMCALVLALGTIAPAAAEPLGPFAEPSGAWASWGTRGSVNLYGLALTSPSNGWMVGAGGAIWRWNGTDWVSETSPTTEDLNAIDTVPGSTTEAYAVGGRATILHRQANGVWEIVTPAGLTTQLDSIDMVSATEGWAVGDDGLILHTTTAPTGWTVQSSGVTTLQLHAVSMFSNTDGFAVGGLVGQNNMPDIPVILRYDGTNWNPMVPPRLASFYHVITRGPDEAWAVGTNRTVLRWQRSNPSAWEVVYENPTGQTGGTFYAISMPAADDGWISGTGGELWHWNGTTWGTAPVVSTGTVLYFAQLPNTREGWAVGGGGAIWRYTSPALASLTGTVTGLLPCGQPAGPVGGAEVRIQGGAVDVTVTTDNTGVYTTAADLPAGTYTVTFTAATYESATVQVTLTDGQVATLDQALTSLTPCPYRIFLPLVMQQGTF